MYETLNASYRVMDQYMRASQRVAEQMWMPWMRLLPPEQLPLEPWIRAYGD